jgi:plastocyanin
VTITFPNAALTYAPPCIKVKAGTKLVFNGDFSSHPLNGGTNCTTDATSPIATTSTGTTASFTLANTGTFGWFCEFHCSLGMQGAAFVQ